MVATLVRQPKLLGIAMILSAFTFILVLWRSGYTYTPDVINNYLKDRPSTSYYEPGLSDEQSTPQPVRPFPPERPVEPEDPSKSPIELEQSAEPEQPAPAQGLITEWKPTWRPDVHRLKDANPFLGHILNVTFAKGITTEEAASTCVFENPDEVNFQWGESGGWGVDLSWVKEAPNETAIDYYRTAWGKFIRDDALEFDRYVDKFSGRGIVIVGGNGRSLKRVQVILKQLHKLGCRLPVELHYWGAEFLENHGEILRDLWPNIHFNNLASHDNIFPTIYSGLVKYALKTAAVLNSRFAHILLLDSDNIPVQDPETLFETDTYKEYGTIFWPDVARTRPNNPIWPVTNTHCRTDEWEQESGQMLVNKHKFWYHLQLSHWFISNLTYGEYFRNLILGDKDTFRFAWHALQTQYGKPPEWVTSVGTQHGDFYCGHSFGQYHPNGKLAFLHGGLLKTMRKEVVMWELEANGGVFQRYKRAPLAADTSANPKTRMTFDGQEYLPEEFKPEGGLEVSWCMDFEGVQAQPLENVLPGFQQTYQEIGGYWIANDTGDGSIWDGNL